MDNIKVIYGEMRHRVSIQEFLKIENLSGITKKIQDSIKTLYQLNETEPPLFHFPDFPENAPLTIDCSTATDDDCSAHYIQGIHVIEFVQNLHENPHLDNAQFTEILAHELTHAEQDVEEITKLEQTNGLQFHQISILKEGQAFAKGHMVYSMLQGNERYTSASERINAVDKEIQWLLQDSYYRSSWAEFFPISENDQPIRSIPKAFNLSNNLLSSIRTFPEVPLRPEARNIEYIRNNYLEITTYFSTCSDILRKISADKLLEKLLFIEDTKPETLQQDLCIVDFLFRLYDSEGKRVFPENKLEDMFLEQSAFKGRDESKLIKEAEKAVDSEGNKIFPDNFSLMARDMPISKFLACLDRYFEIINPTKSIDSDPIETQVPGTKTDCSQKNHSVKE